MQKIPLSLAKPGMVLAREVRKDDDDVSPPICGKGMPLSEALISRLEKMGIQAVTVEGKPVSMEGDKTVDEMLALLERRFSKVMDDPLMAGLKGIYREHIMKHSGGADAGQAD
jgi:hypothetical protein